MLGFVKNKILLKTHVHSGIILLICSLFIAGLAILLSDTFSMETIKRFSTQPLLFFYNWLPIALFVGLLYVTTSSIFISYTAGGGLFFALALVSYFKQQLRGDPLIPYDIILGGEVAYVINKDSLFVTPDVVISIFLFIIVAIGLRFVKPPYLCLHSKILLTVMATVLIATSYIAIYSDTIIYDNAPLTGSRHSQTDKYRSRGFVFSFLTNMPFVKTFEKPDGYSAKKAQHILQRYEEHPAEAYSGVRPNIIAVMGESFFDIDRIPEIEFTEGLHPLKNYNRIIKDAYAGYLYTSAFGGGTANTEFSFLTGVNSCFFSGATIYSMLVRKNIDALPRILSDFGYYTEAIHPGHDWFYNRKNVFKYMGFDARYFKDDKGFANAPTRKGNILDQNAMAFMLGKFDEFRKEPENQDKPYFGFMVTIENHGAYSPNKPLYETPYFVRPEGMSDQTFIIINNYLDGLNAADIALKGLVDALAESDEPVVLVHFGDHLPYLGQKLQSYRQLSYPMGQDGGMDGYLNMYRVPFFIWSNSAAKKEYQKQGVTLPTGTASEMNVCYLPAELMDYIGFSKNRYFNYLTDIKQVIPVITEKYSKTETGFTDALPAGIEERRKEFETVCNYKLFDEKIK